MVYSLGTRRQREHPADVEHVDAIRYVLFGGSMPEERRWLLKRLLGQVEGSPVDRDKMLGLEVNKRLYGLHRVYMNRFP